MPAESAGRLYLAEPAGQYRRYPPLVIDCSVLAAVMFDEPARETAALAMAGKELFAPNLLDHEIVSVALKKSHAGLKPNAGQLLKDLLELRVTRIEINVEKQFTLALKFGLSAYDAAYLQLAIDLRAPLATFDQKLSAAATRALAAI
jgi:predicted nucleic acid-binding protein